MVDIPFAEWYPDRAVLGAPTTVATNVIPWVDGYKSFPSFSVISKTPLSAKFQGGIFGRNSASVSYQYAGDATKLYILIAGVWTDKTRAAGVYATAATEWWEFVKWGETIIATNFADVIQVVTLNGSSQFAALGGSPPKARHIAIVRDFVVLGNVTDGTVRPSRIQWSAINNSADWTVSAATQSDYQDIQGDGGWIQKIVGGEFGVVFQERCIWKMTYIGSPEIFQFDQIDQNRGTFAPQSVVAWGNMIFYVSDDGFYQITGGSGSVPIGEGKIDKFFLNDYQVGNAHLITSSIDPINKLVLWAYPGAGFTNKTTNRVLVYNWVYKKWALVESTIEGFCRFASDGYTLEGLDALSTNLDSFTTSFDSRSYTGGAMSLAAFNSAHNVGTYSGTAMAATVDTGEIEFNKGQRTTVQEVRPLIDGQAAAVTIGTRNLVSDNVSFGSSISQNASGFCPARTNANFHRFRVTTSGAFNFIQGLKVEHTAIGNGR